MAKSDEILKRTKDLLTQKASEKEFERTRLERERQQLITSLGQEIARIIAPAINNLAQSQQVTFSKMRQMLREIKVEAPKMPQISIPEIRVPEPKVQVNVPDVRVPPIVVPETKINFPASMQVTMDQYDSKRPLPVMMMGTDGKPMSFSMGASGGKADFLTIKDIRNSTGGSLIDADGFLKVTGAFSGLTDAELRASSVPVAQASEAVWSTYVTGATGTVATYLTDADGDYRDVLPTDMTTALDRTIDSISVAQVSDGNFSVNVLSGTITAVTSITNSTATNIVDSGGVAYSGSNPLPVTLSDTITTAPINVRGSRATAYATISSDSATTLLAGVASTYLDMVYVMGANQSDGAVTLDFYTGAGGATMLSLEIPANSTAGVAPATAIPMTEAAQAWYMYYADSDVTGTTVDVTALFSKET